MLNIDSYSFAFSEFILILLFALICSSSLYKFSFDIHTYLLSFWLSCWHAQSYFLALELYPYTHTGLSFVITQIFVNRDLMPVQQLACNS